MTQLKTLATAILVGLAVLLTACGGNLAGGGIDGKFLNDALPEGAAIWHPIIDEGGKTRDTQGGVAESSSTDMIRQKWQLSVPCPDIKKVVGWQTKKGSYAFEVLLTTDKYGGKYYPPHPNGGDWHWTKPLLTIGESKFVPDTEGYEDWHLAHYKRADVKHIADHCEVELQYR